MSYRKDNLPDYITRLKTVVEKDLEIMTKEIENDIDSDKYFNVLKGRRMAANDAVDILKKIDLLQKEVDGLDIDSLGSYYRDTIPVLIGSLKDMYSLNFEVLNLKNDFISEEKLHNLIRSRKEASTDCEWILTKIDELEAELNTKEKDKTVKSWALQGLAEEEN